MKKLIIYFFIVVMLAMAVSAAESTTPSDYRYYDDANAAINTTLWNVETTGFSWGANYGTGANWSNGGYNETSASALLDSNVIATSGHTTCIKVYDTGNNASGARELLIIEKVGAGGDFLMIGVNGATDQTHYSTNDGVTWHASVARTKGRHEFCIEFNNTYEKFYLDSVNIRNSTSVSWTGDRVAVGRYGATSSLGFSWDVFRQWAGSYGQMPQGNATPVVQNAVFISPTPISGASNLTNVTINVDCNGSLYLWFGNTTSDSFLVLRNSSTKSYTTGVNLTSTWFYMASCWNASVTGGIGANTTTRNWTYDVLIPTVTIGDTNFFTTNGKSKVNQYNKSLLVPINITMADANLMYAYEINISKNGMTWYYELNQTLGSVKIFNLTKTINISNLTTGSYNITVTAADTHTAKEIKDYDVTKSNKKLEFKTTEGNNIVIETPDDSITNAKKKKDRYTFEFNFTDNLETTRTFSIKANNPIFYYPSSEYDAHFVVGNGVHGNWVDFMGSGSTYTVTKISDKRYDITFDDIMPQIIFNSIGGLNEFAFNGTWFRGEYFYTNPDSADGERNQFQLNVTVDNTISSVNTSFFYNSTSWPSTVSIYGGSYIFTTNISAPNISGSFPVLWFMNYTQVGDPTSYQFNITFNNTVASFGIAQCSPGINVTVLYVNISDENYPANRLNATLQIDSTVWISNKANSANFTTVLSGSANYTICMLTNTTLYADIYFLTNASAGRTHRYYIFNTTINNSDKQYIDLFNFANDTGLSVLTITLRHQESFEFYPGVLVKLQRRYVAEGVWRTVQMGLSDDFGLVNFDIYERTEDYQTIFTDQDNNLIFNSDRYNYVCSSGRCDYTQLLGQPIDMSTMNNLVIIHYFNNNTKMYQVNFSDSLGTTTSLRLMATKRTGGPPITVCNSVAVGSSGTLNCNLSAYDGEIFIDVFSTASPERELFSEIVKVARQALQQLMTQKEQAFLGLVISTPIILMGTFISAVAVVISTLVAIVALFMFAVLSPITLKFIIAAAVLGIGIAMKLRQ